MQIIEAQHLEDCFNGSAGFRYHLDQPWTAQRIRSLGLLCSLDHFRDFPRPFFRLRAATGLEVQGIEGEMACRVVFPKTGREALRTDWERFLMEFPDAP